MRLGALTVLALLSGCSSLSSGAPSLAAGEDKPDHYQTVCVPPPRYVDGAALKQCYFEGATAGVCVYITPDPPGNRCLVAMYQEGCDGEWTIGRTSCEIDVYVPQDDSQKEDLEGTI